MTKRLLREAFFLRPQDMSATERGLTVEGVSRFEVEKYDYASYILFAPRKKGKKRHRMFGCKVTADASPDALAMNKECLYSDGEAEMKHRQALWCHRYSRLFISTADHCATELKASTCFTSKTLHLLGHASSATELQQTSATELIRKLVDGLK